MINSVYKIIILSSGDGSNLQAIIDQLHHQHNIEISAIISDKPSRSIQRALDANITCLFLPKYKHNTRQEYDLQLKKLIYTFQFDLIVLSGFMRILSPEFIKDLDQKVINIHPSLLPKYKGLNTHQRAIDARDKKHGTTIHYVDKTLDGGEIIAQKEIEILPFDTAETLQQKIKLVEHSFYSDIILQLSAESKTISATKPRK